MKLFKALISFIIKQRIATSVSIILACLYATFLIFSEIKVDNSLTIWFLENDKSYQEYSEFQKEQGSDEIIVLMIPTEDALAKNHLQKLNNLHNKIDSLELVNATFSLVKAQYPIIGNDEIIYKNIINNKRSNKAIKSLLKKLPAIRDNLLTDDNKTSFFYIQLKSIEETEAVKDELLATIKQKIDSEIRDYKISGPPILVEEINNSVSTESLLFAFITGSIICLLLLIILPDLRYLYIALLTVIVPVCLLFGIYILLGYKLNMISMLIPTILMVYAVSDIIHIINIHYLHLKEHPNQSKIEQIQEALFKSLKPCFYTTITTIIGYLALYLSPLPAFKITGIFSFIGLVIAFFSAYVISAIAFSFMNFKFNSDKKVITFKIVDLDNLIHHINKFTTNNKKSILVVALIVFILGIVAIPYINVNSNSVDLLHNGKAKKDLVAIEKSLKGVVRVSLDISTEDKSSILNKKNIALIEKFQEKIKENQALSTPVSIIDVKHFLEKRYGIQNTNLNIKIDSIPKPKNEFFQLISDDFSRVSINVNAISLGSKELEHLFADLHHSFDKIFGEKNNFSLKINGSSPLYVKLHNYILTTQFRSFGTALLLSFFILILFIRKLRTSTLALIPNVLPLALTSIIMAILYIPMEASNAMIAPIMIGIAMDDTIHLIHNYKKYKKLGFSVEESMDKAMLFTGRALISTTITLVLGFLVLLFSRLTNMQEFGFLCAATILFALIADGIVLPAIIKTFDK